MREIRAFVGHSFAKEDAEPVTKFLKFFDQLARAHAAFTWEHAEEAEPIEITEKVMRIIEDKNVFVGICTKKERSIAPSALRSAWLPWTLLGASEPQFGWKTSDWIIQEIGLAAGRNMKLILLIEEGVRKPGGLQGDTEYIEFKRDTPETAFGKLFEMIGSLNPRPKASVLEAAEAPQTEAPQATAEEKHPWAEPKADWHRKDYELGMSYSIFKGDLAKAGEISDAYLQTPDAQAGINAATWNAEYQQELISWRKGGDFGELKRLAREHSKSSEIWASLGRAYRSMEQFNEAAEAFSVSAEIAAGEQDRLVLTGLAAECRQHAGDTAQAELLLDDMRKRAPNAENGEAELLSTLRNIAETRKDNDQLVAALERHLALDPLDHSARFALAYTHSEHNREALALYHYLKIPRDNRDPVAWNNLGVALDTLDMPAKSVDAYREAEKGENTLAMNNLAIKLLDGGFVAEAQAKCDDAIQRKDYHKNVGTTLNRLRSIPEKEAEKQEELLAKTRPVSEFYQAVGGALTWVRPTNVGGKWSGPDCELEVEVKGEQFRATGIYVKRQSLLSALTIYGTGPISGTAPEKIRIEYSGTIRGAVVIGRVSRVPEGERVSLLSAGQYDKPAMLILTANRAQVMELDKADGKFYELNRKGP